MKGSQLRISGKNCRPSWKLSCRTVTGMELTFASIQTTRLCIVSSGCRASSRTRRTLTGFSPAWTIPTMGSLSVPGRSLARSATMSCGWPADSGVGHTSFTFGVASCCREATSWKRRTPAVGRICPNLSVSSKQTKGGCPCAWITVNYCPLTGSKDTHPATVFTAGYLRSVRWKV